MNNDVTKAGSSKTTQVEMHYEDSEEKNELDIATSSKTTSKNETLPTASTSYSQLKRSEEISVLKADLHSLYKRRSLNFLTTEESKTLKLKEKELEEKEKQLKSLEQAQKRQQKFREKRKMEMSKVLESHPELKKEVPSLREKKGRPRIEEDQRDLLNTIAEIAIHGSAAEDKRRSELMRSVKTLDDLKDELNKLGYNISRSAVYLRLLPKRSNTQEGKRHVVTVPVKLIRASNDKHSSHVDGKFCTATLNHMEEIAAVLGPRQVFFLSQDDKSRVPIGLTAANKQAPLLMHVEYKVTLPDHDWVVAPQHKLIPSVYAGIVIKENCLDSKVAVTYSGPTFVAIRSGKHSSSTALSHANDIETLLSMPEFDQYCRVGAGGQAKPVFMFSVDGGPDENPRYEKVIRVAIHHFVKQNLDACLIATNAPGRSAFNRVERRMAPLSKELTGVILPHDTFGTHLDSQGRTIDVELEKENFKKAGESLADIWNGLVIDKHPVCAKYISPEHSEMAEASLEERDMVWRAEHVRESQYLTQIVKCLDEKCCQPSRSDFFKVLPKRFLPPPFPLIQTINGLTCPNFPIDDPEHQTYSFPSVFVNIAMSQQAILPISAKVFQETPYDLYCPSVQNQLEKRICKRCGLYHSSITR